MNVTVTAADLRAAAMDDAAAGEHIFPVRPDAKEPLTEHGFHDASADADQVDAWWLRWPSANIGWVPGNSGHIVLDFDPHTMDAAARELAERLEREALTRRIATPADGWHLIYTLPEGQRVGNSKGALPAGVDVRAHDGYVLRPPSVVAYRGDKAAQKGVPNGHRGQYLITVDREPAPIPPWLLEAILRGVRTAAPAGAVDERRMKQSLDHVLRVLRHGGIAHDEPERYGDGWKVVLCACPWNPPEDPHADDRAAYVIVQGSGKIMAGCHHNRCTQRIADAGGNGWGILRRITGYDDLRTVPATTEPPPEWDNEPPPITYFPDFLAAPAAHVNGTGKGPAPAALRDDAPIAEAVHVERWRSLSYTGAAYLTKPPREWLFPGLLPKQADAWLAGEWGTGKSLIGADWCFAASLGRTFAYTEDGAGWTPVRPLRCVYMAGEGQGGLRDRLLALCRKWNVEAPPFPIVDEVPQLFDPAAPLFLSTFLSAYPVLVTENIYPAEPDLLLFDTWDAGTVGMDENKGLDVRRARTHLAHIRAVLGCATLVLHHPSKGGSIMRGHGGTLGGADLIAAVEKQGAGRGVFRAEKMRDGKAWTPIAYRIEADDADGQQPRIEWEQQTAKSGTTQGKPKKEARYFAFLLDNAGTFYTGAEVAMAVDGDAGDGSNARKVLQGMVNAASITARTERRLVGIAERDVQVFGVA